MRHSRRVRLAWPALVAAVALLFAPSASVPAQDAAPAVGWQTVIGEAEVLQEARRYADALQLVERAIAAGDLAGLGDEAELFGHVYTAELVDVGNLDRGRVGPRVEVAIAICTADLADRLDLCGRAVRLGTMHPGLRADTDALRDRLVDTLGSGAIADPWLDLTVRYHVLESFIRTNQPRRALALVAGMQAPAATSMEQVDLLLRLTTRAGELRAVLGEPATAAHLAQQGLVFLARAAGPAGMSEQQVALYSLQLNDVLARALIVQRRYDEAIAQVQGVLARWPRPPPGPAADEWVEVMSRYGLLLSRVGRSREALEVLMQFHDARLRAAGNDLAAIGEVLHDIAQLPPDAVAPGHPVFRRIEAMLDDYMTVPGFAGSAYEQALRYDKARMRLAAEDFAAADRHFAAAAEADDGTTTLFLSTMVSVYRANIARRMAGRGTSGAGGAGLALNDALDGLRAALADLRAAAAGTRLAADELSRDTNAQAVVEEFVATAWALSRRMGEDGR